MALPSAPHIARTLARVIGACDADTGGHSRRVTAYALMLAAELALPEADRAVLRLGTPLHDLGKLALDAAVLRKAGPLTDSEFDHVKDHPVLGVALLRSFPQLAPVLPIVRSHHERWDGSGYPDRLAGERIPHLARVVSIADVFDALTSTRPYRAALPLDAALAYLDSGAGTLFDPHFTHAFLRLRPRLQARCS